MLRSVERRSKKPPGFSTAFQVFGMRHRFEVIWVTATSLPTLVVQLETVGDRSVNLFPLPDVCQSGPPVSLDVAVPTRFVDRGDGQPAARSRIDRVRLFSPYHILACLAPFLEASTTPVRSEVGTKSIAR